MAEPWVSTGKGNDSLPTNLYRAGHGDVEGSFLADAVFTRGSATSKATAGNVTLTAAEVLTSILVVDCAGAGRTYTLPTAALLVAALPFKEVGMTISLLVVNGSDAAESITLAAGSGGGFDANQTAGSRIVEQNSSKNVLIRFTAIASGSEAYVVYA